MAGAGYINPRSISALAIFFPVLAIIFVTGRVYSRRIKHAALGADDYLSIGSLLLLVGCSIVILIGTAHHTFGYHAAAGSPLSNAILEGKLSIAYDIMFGAGITMVKLSFLFFYRRVFRSRTFVAFNLFMIVFVSAWGFVSTILPLVDCRDHLDWNWLPIPAKEQATECVSPIMLLFLNSLLSCLLDLVIVIMPMTEILSLHLQPAKKAAVVGMFALGGLCIAASTIRLAAAGVLYWDADVAVPTHAKAILGINLRDPSLTPSLVIFWLQMEFGVANIACCLPMLKPLGDSRPFRTLDSALSTISLSSVRRMFRSSSQSTSTGREDDSVYAKETQLPNSKASDEIRLHEGTASQRLNEAYYYGPSGTRTRLSDQDLDLAGSGSTYQLSSFVAANTRVDPKAVEEGKIQRRISFEQMDS